MNCGLQLEELVVEELLLELEMDGVLDEGEVQITGVLIRMPA